MTILLDTHIWLWMLTDPGRLGALEEIVRDKRNELLLSAASSWEVGIKYALGRLALPEPPETYVPSRIGATGVSTIAIEHAHALAVSRLPLHHRDPFDRLLVAQAQIYDVPIATADAQLRPYDVHCITPNS